MNTAAAKRPATHAITHPRRERNSLRRNNTHTTPTEVSWKHITAGQGTFSGYRRRTQKHALTCDDATPKIASYPGAPDCRGRHLFFCSGSKYFGWSG